LAASPPTAIPTCFGQKDSFAAHCAEAHARSLRLAIVDNERIAFDVDGPADHALLRMPRPAAGT
jgi:2-phospho-L-lactate guanylyltransferase (CobY/MobA/RfbA family)